jgi:hypothetical protein
VNALLAGALAGCLSPVPDNSAPGGGPLPAPIVVDAGAAPLDVAAGMRAVRGVFEGACAGVVLAAVSTRDAAMPTHVARFPERAFALPLPHGDAVLHYGCDADGDGVVEAADVRVVPLGRGGERTPLVLPLAGRSENGPPRVEQLGERWVPPAVAPVGPP